MRPKIEFNHSTDLRDLIFRDISNKRVEAKIWTTQNGVVVGIKRIVNKATELGLKIEPYSNRNRTDSGPRRRANQIFNRKNPDG
ncbi:MAG: hypothetical protein ACFFCD_09990, partial [Promethearchaeota archaeon]